MHQQTKNNLGKRKSNFSSKFKEFQRSVQQTKNDHTQTSQYYKKAAKNFQRTTPPEKGPQKHSTPKKPTNY
tara:strand:- start:766 stop:978 length:213 start_codon:yes stop_codon:yes gene_type:complete